MWRFLIFMLPSIALAEVPQGAPNADFQPGFAEQTRAPALDQTQVEVTTFARGLNRPWGIAALPDGQFVVTERDGSMRIVGTDGTVSRPLAGLPAVAARGQGGMLDVAVSPHFAQDRLIFFTYAKPIGQRAATAAGRARLSTDGSLRDVQEIFVQTPAVRSDRHFGSRIVPHPDGTLFITTGDRGAGDRGKLVQRTDNTHGKTIRLNFDGSIPDDNPYVGRMGDDAIWSLGHRNIQGAALRDGLLWTIEHGPAGGDELNQPQPRGNYGWPVVSYGVNYDGRDIGAGRARAQNMAEPVYYWDPVIAPGGMIFYDGTHSAWRGDILVGSLNPGALVRLKLNQNRVVGEERLLQNAGRVRDVVQGRDGAVYVLIDAKRGQILRVAPQG